MHLKVEKQALFLKCLENFDRWIYFNFQLSFCDSDVTLNLKMTCGTIPITILQKSQANFLEQAVSCYIVCLLAFAKYWKYTETSFFFKFFVISKFKFSDFVLRRQDLNILLLKKKNGCIQNCKNCCKFWRTR